MADDVYVSFGGDTGPLEAAAAVARAEINSLTREMRELAAEIVKTGAAADSDLAQRLNALGAQFSQAKAHSAELKEELGKLTPKGEEEPASFVERMVGSLQGALAPVAELRAGLGEMTEIVAGAFAVEQIVEFVKSMGELGEQTERASQILGLSTRQVGELQFAFAATGTDASNLDQTVGRFEVSLAKAAGGTGPAAAGLKALGLSAQELIGLSFPEQLDKISQAVSRFADGTNKAAALQALGRGFVELIPLLNEGSAGFDEMRERADATNTALEAGLTKSLDEMNLSFTTLGASLKGVAIQGFAPFVDVTRQAADGMSALAQATSRAEQQGGEFNGVLQALAIGLRGVLSVLATLETIYAEVQNAGVTAFTALKDATIGYGGVDKDVFTALGEALPAFFRALLTAGETAFGTLGKEAVDFGGALDAAMHFNAAGAKAAFDQMATDGKDALNKIGDGFSGVFDFSKAAADAHAVTAAIEQDIKTGADRSVDIARDAAARVKALWGVAAEAAKEPNQAEGAKPQVPALDEQTAAKNKALQDQLAASIEATNAEVQAEEKATADKIALYAREAQAKQITESQKVALTLAALQQGLDHEQDALNDELAMNGLSLKQKQALLDEEAKVEQAYAAGVAKIQEDAAKKTEQQWDSAMTTINSAMDSQVKGLLTGTENWHTAFKNVLTDLTVKTIEFFVNWGLQQAENVAKSILLDNTMVAAHVTGAAAMAAADQTSSAAGLGAMLSHAISAITIDAGQAGAGVTAFLAPVLGPAAVPEGLATEAAVLGMIYDTGAWSVPQDGLAAIHQGEMVIPSRGGIADEFRDFMGNGGFAGASGGGSPNVQSNAHFHINAIDGASVKQMLRDNSDEVLSSVTHAVKRGGLAALRRLKFT